MPQVQANGIDWSSGWTDGKTIRDAGYDFVGRYMSEDWRGLRAEEVTSYRANNVGIIAYAEYDTLSSDGSQNSDMMGGGVRGAAAASYGDGIRKKLGLADQMPLYFTLDVQPGVVPWSLVGAYLDAAADALKSKDRVGFYGGLAAIKWYLDVWGGKWPNQTYAWSTDSDGNYVMDDRAILWQYDNYNNNVAGLDVDLNQAFAINYGQTQAFENVIQPVPLFITPKVPDWFSTALAQRYPTVGRWDWNKQTLILDPIRHNANLKRRSNQYSEPSVTSGHAGVLLEAGKKIHIERLTTVKGTLAEQHEDRQWVLTDRGTWIPESALDLDFTIRRR